jgi:hypothetical protein
MRTWLPPAHLALSIVILAWDVVLAGRIAQLRQASRPMQTMAGLMALLVIPALLLTLATSTFITGRSVVLMDWVWPAVLLLFAVQSGYALATRTVNYAWGVPIAAYNLLLAATAITRYLVGHGHQPATPFIALLAAETTAMVVVTRTSAVLAVPYYLTMPIASPAYPAVRRITAFFRAALAAVALVWVIIVAMIGLPGAFEALSHLNAHKGARLRERPNADFAVGLKILPDIRSYPSGSALRADYALADTLGVDALAVVVVPDASRSAIDSLARMLEPSRRDSTTLIVSLGYRGKIVPEFAPTSLNESQRMVTLRRVMSRLQPDIILPAEDPYGAGAAAVGQLPLSTWKAYFSDAARIAKAVKPTVKIGVSISSFSARDSALYAWASAADSPIDVIGFSLFPSPYTGGDLIAAERAADRWLRVTPTAKELWVVATGGYPRAYGETSQERVIWQALAWATNHPAIKGLIVYEAGDYGQSRGLRAPNGRLRPASMAVMRAIRGLRESER